MEDFNRQYIKEHFQQLTPEEREQVLQSLPPEERLAGLSAEQIQLQPFERHHLDQIVEQLIHSSLNASRLPRRPDASA